MKSLLISPAVRENVAALAKDVPLPNLSITGRALVEHWLDHLARRGAKEVIILASDRPEQVRALVDDGSRWGLQISVRFEPRELTPAQAREKFCAGHGQWLQAPDDVILMDHLPGQASFPLFDNFASWHSALMNWLPHAAAPDRIGFYEIRPGVWMGMHVHIAPNARLVAPCWLGENVHVGSGATLGPLVIVENNSLIEPGAKIMQSIIGEDTFVGEGTEIRHSIAWGSTLANWRLNSCIQVPEEFLLCSLKKTPVSPGVARMPAPIEKP